MTGTDACDLTDHPDIRCTERASDPRVSGSATRTITLEPPFPDQGALMWNDVIIAGPEGTWTGTGYGVMGKDGVIHNLEIMSGSGAYRGLVYSTWGTVSADGNATHAGLIREGTLPPAFPVPAPSPSPAG